MSEPANREFFRVEGGAPLSGRIRPEGNKNEALPALAACCLTDEPVVLENVPAIRDVEAMLEILAELGASVERPDPADPTCLRVHMKNPPPGDLPEPVARKLRASVVFAGPLLARSGRVSCPRPGGDLIGRRRLDTHLLAFRDLGAEIAVTQSGFEAICGRLRGADILLDEASVTGTGNALCAAVLAEGETVIRNAASEPHVQGLCRMLAAMGADIGGAGSNVLRIRGVDRLRGTRHRIGPDYLEVGSFISLAAVTGGDLVIEGVDMDDLRMILIRFGQLGIEPVADGKDLRVPAGQTLEVVPEFGGAIPHMDDAPWPGFPADMTSVALVTATQCKGTVLIHEKMFESRLFFVDRLVQMGARIVLCDPHRAVVIGPQKLYGATISSPDIRAGMALLIASLCAEGTSEIGNIVQIDRGFARIDQRLASIGARIERVVG